LPGVPEYCKELHLITALVLLQRSKRSQQDRRLLRKAIRKFRSSVRNAPRLRALAAMLELEVAIHADDRNKAVAVASEIIASFRKHENLHVTRNAHLTISRLVQGHNVMAAAEHDRVARNLGR